MLAIIQVRLLFRIRRLGGPLDLFVYEAVFAPHL